MSAVRPIGEIPRPAPVPQLLVELPSRSGVFVENVRDLIFPRALPPLELRSAPAPYWPDVFVRRSIPWDAMLKSCGCHFAALALLIGFTRLFALEPRVTVKPTFDHSEIVYYQPAEYLPPLDTRSPHTAHARKADPEFSRQPVISVPPEADNHTQTIVTPPNVKLKRDVAMPNVVAWSTTEQKPRLAIPDAPLTLASEVTRLAPRLTNSVVTPPPDAAHLAPRRNSPALETSVVAPPPELQNSTALSFHAPQSTIVAPPPSVVITSTRPLGNLNIGSNSVIAPAPQLPVAEQRTASASRGAFGSPSQVVPPPPAVGSSGPSGSSMGSRGQMIALSLHPAVGAPPVAPAGNRRGSFAATPDGHAEASGTPGSSSGDPNAANSNARNEKEPSTNVPSGLYVGNAAPTSSVAGDPAKASSYSVNPNLLANVRPPRIGSAPHPMQLESASKLTAAERAVFGNRRFYSVSLNMPNLSSSGGSWVIRFAELNHESDKHEPGGAAIPSDLSEPMATRKVDPAYPMQLMRENVAGTVILYAVIHADGTVGNVRVLSSVDDRLDEFARAAIAQWKFEPATKNGAPVDVEATFQIPFRPARLGSNF